MIKNILWDFDGVILDSMKIKGDGFIELFKKYDIDKVKEIESYHYKNGGISRFDKIEYFFKNILKKDINSNEVLSLADQFSNIIKEKLYEPSNLIEETVDFIKYNFQKYNFHIVSGAEHNELNEICTKLDLVQYFKSINGSPIKKDILVKDILEKNQYNKEETILIGDSFTDYNAANKNQIRFFGYNNRELEEYENYIEYGLDNINNCKLIK